MSAPTYFNDTGGSHHQIDMVAHDNLTLVDAHVHIYDCFNLPSFLDSAYENFSAEARRHCTGTGFTGVLLLTETSNDNFFHRLGSYADNNESVADKLASEWHFHRTIETCSLLARSNRGGHLILVAGRQVVTAENLEVLALCIDASFEDGLPFTETVETVRKTGGLPAIPWGAGKWLGRRGALLTKFLKNAPASDVFLGDNSARPIFWRRPLHFRLARSRAIRILPGSDPLPFPSEHWRPGSFGFSVKARVNLEHPARDLKRLISDPSIIVQPYGHLEGVYRFFYNQLTMQLRKRFPIKMGVQ